MGVTQAAGLSLRWFRDNLAEVYKDKAALLGVDSPRYRLAADACCICRISWANARRI